MVMVNIVLEIMWLHNCLLLKSAVILLEAMAFVVSVEALLRNLKV